MGPLLALVCRCFREQCYCHMQDCAFLFSLDNLPLKSLIVFIFGNQILNLVSYKL